MNTRKRISAFLLLCLLLSLFAAQIVLAEGEPPAETETVTESVEEQEKVEKEEKNGFEKWIQKIKDEFYLCFIKGNRWKMLAEGLWLTIRITFFAVLFGIVIGLVIAMIRTTYDNNFSKIHGILRPLIAFFNAISKIYLTVIRGTPVVVQLMIMYFVIFASSTNKFLTCVIAFGVNSGAYVAEIFRSGLMSIDRGQMEAGRSLGFNYIQTMWHIIIPQAFKNVLPTLANEFIVLLKETSVSGYVAMTDLTRAGDIIRGTTFVPFMPLLAVALIYLVIVMGLTWIVGKFERRLRTSDH